MVSKIHPNTSFLVLQLPLPVSNFLRETASLLRFSSVVGAADAVDAMEQVGGVGFGGERGTLDPAG
jgi:hypothetical protein